VPPRTRLPETTATAEDIPVLTVSDSKQLREGIENELLDFNEFDRGGPIELIRPGDRVFFAPGEERWHGAYPSRFLTHLAMATGRRRRPCDGLGRPRHR
jgi:hypothetical protein